MKTTKLVFPILLFALLQISCNPECEPVFGLDVTPKFASPGTQVLVTAQPISALNRSVDVFFNDQKADAVFIDNMGLMVTVPADTPERATLKVTDSDCEHSLDFNVREREWFTNNPDFVFPSPPDLVLPSIPPSFPPALSNSWFSPQDLDYCIWFKMEQINHPIVQDSCLETNTIDASASIELSLCNTANNPLYHENPVFGILDKENNIVHFWVDRTNVNGMDLGIEEFIGQFIDMNLSGYNNREIPCAGGQGWEVDGTMILVTSQKTGKQLLMYRIDNSGFGSIC